MLMLAWPYLIFLSVSDFYLDIQVFGIVHVTDQEVN